MYARAYDKGPESVMERDFSFTSFVIYALRKWVVVVVLALAGVAAGVMYSLTYKTTNIAVYEGSLTFSITAYHSLVGSGAEMNEGTYSMYTEKANEVMNKAADESLRSDTYERMKSGLFTGVATEANRRKLFFEQLFVRRSGNSIIVDFAYDVVKEADRELAAQVVETYLSLARDAVVASSPELDGDVTALTVSEVKQNFNVFKDYGASTAGSGSELADLVSRNERPSIVTSAALGFLLGVVAGIVAICIVYLADPKVKDLSFILPEDRARVLHAGKEACEDGALTAFATAVHGAGAKSVLVSAVKADANALAFANKAAERLAGSGEKVTVVDLGAEGADWRTYFAADKPEPEGRVIYAYGGGEDGALVNLALYTDGAVLLLDQKKTKAKAFAAGANAIAEYGGRCLGTVVYDITDGWLG